MRAYNDIVPVDFTATFPEVIDQLFARAELARRRLVPVKIADETDAERDIVQVIAMHMAALKLASPPVSHLDLSVPARSTVANDKMVGQPIGHAPNVPVIIIENARVALPRPTVVHHDELPPAAQNRRAIDLLANRARQIVVCDCRARPKPPAPPRRRSGWRGFITLLRQQPRFLDVYLRHVSRSDIRFANKRLRRSWRRHGCSRFPLFHRRRRLLR